MVVQCKFCNGKGKIFETLAGYRPCSVCGGAGEFDINISQDNLSPAEKLLVASAYRKKKYEGLV